MTPVQAKAADPMERLIAEIRDYQRRYRLSDRALAAKLGLPRTTWRAIRIREYRPRLQFAQDCLPLVEFRDAALNVLVPEKP